MEYTTLGASGLRISKLCLGTMHPVKTTEAGEAVHFPTKEETDSVVKKALDLGINFFETSCHGENTLGAEYLGAALAKYTDRSRVILAVKIYAKDAGLSRKEIFRQVNLAMKLLRTHYLDHVIIQGWDASVPIEETMEALCDLIKTKQIKSIGAADMRAYQFLKAQEVARNHHWRRFVTMQSRYNLIYREAERELLGLLKEENVSMTPDTPLASGRLAELCREFPLEVQKHSFLNHGSDISRMSDYAIVLRVKEMAEKYQATMSQIALAWLFRKEQVAAPVVHAAVPEHLEEIAAAVNVKLTPADMQYLEELYIPHILLDVC